MKTVEIEANYNGFEYNNIHYSCSEAIKKDKKLILNEAETNHKNDLDNFYNKETLRPTKVRLYLDENNTPQFGMMIYVIDYKSDFNGRYACGNYYPIYDEVLIPHFFQGSICW